MAPLETDRFIEIMRVFSRGYVDEFWGPIYGPGGPRIRGVDRLDPTPVPWRELSVAYRVAALADLLELTGEGAGVQLLEAFADDPEFTCGTRPPGWPRPHKDNGQQFLNPAALGAALVFVSEGIGSEAVADVARNAGERMIG
jgi:hypothetical protein